MSFNSIIMAPFNLESHKTGSIAMRQFVLFRIPNPGDTRIEIATRPSIDELVDIVVANEEEYIGSTALVTESGTNNEWLIDWDDEEEKIKAKEIVK
jgi:hypothetical protein